jgi:hypothetical protein
MSLRPKKFVWADWKLWNVPVWPEIFATKSTDFAKNFRNLTKIFLISKKIFSYIYKISTYLSKLLRDKVLHVEIWSHWTDVANLAHSRWRKSSEQRIIRLIRLFEIRLDPTQRFRRKLEVGRVARFSLVQHTKTGTRKPEQELGQEPTHQH